MSSEQIRTYDRANSVVFLKTDEPFGGLSNMAGGYLLHVGGVRILTSEALYQACRFPHLPEVQRLIIGQTSPMTAKMRSKPYRKNSRQDWDQVRVKIMRWCLRVKLAQNWATFSELLLRTGDYAIVEESRKDDFWGAKVLAENTLVGMNVLGRLLMELREAIKSGGRDRFLCVKPPGIPDFILLGRPIEIICASNDVTASEPMGAGATRPVAEQTSLFDKPVAREGPPPVHVPVHIENRRLAGLKPYPAMKDSDLPWLGWVPEHWEVQRLKRIAQLNPSRIEAHAELAADTPVTFLPMERVGADGRIDASQIVAASQVRSGFTYFRRSDVLVAKITPCFENGKGGCLEFLPTEFGFGSTEFHVLRAGSSMSPQFLYRLTTVPEFRRLGADAMTGAAGQQRVSQTFLADYPVALPPPAEQSAIVRFLDHADRRIRRYVRAKQELIKLLEEQKQAIIHRAVTRGLDPNVCLKPSSVEWLGDVPEHWEVMTLRRVISRAVDGPHHSPTYLDDGIPFLSARNIKTDRWSLDDRKFISEQDYAAFSKRVIPEVGDVLYTKGGTTGIARAVDLPFRFQVWVHVAVLKVKRAKVVPEFLAMILNSPRCYEQAQLFTRGATNQDLGLGRMKDIVFALPPLLEQRTILAGIGDRTRDLLTAIQMTLREIALLREYRTCLIADVVTGKLDVREAAAGLPDEPHELEQPDELETLVEGDAEGEENLSEGDAEVEAAIDE